jgi:hypothetical protein
LNGPPDPFGRRRHFHVGDAEFRQRIDNGVDDDREYRRRSVLASEAIVGKLNASVSEGLASAEARAIIARLGVHSDPGLPEQFAAFIAVKRAQ